MKKQVVGYVLVASCAMLAAGGCAKEQVVRKDVSVAPTATPPSPTKRQEAAKTQPVQQAAVKESAVAETANQSSAQEQLQAALDKIYFDFDSAKLSEAARSTLVKDAGLMKKEPDVKVRIEGNCDERGSDAYNLALGEKRAKAAQKYLVAMGVAPLQLSTISYGKEKPAVAGHDEAAWAKNRRDEFVVLR